MSKELTEKWKNGELEKIQYYVRLENGRICRCLHIGSPNWMRGIDGLDEIVQEVLEPVPSYEEYKELLDLNCYDEYRNKIKSMEKQLKEANKIIKEVSDNRYMVNLSKSYLNKWGVK